MANFYFYFILSIISRIKASTLINATEHSSVSLNCPTYEIQGDLAAIVINSKLDAIKSSNTFLFNLMGQTDIVYRWNVQQSRMEIKINSVNRSHNMKKFICAQADKKGLGKKIKQNTLTILVFNKPQIIEPVSDNTRIGVIFGQKMQPTACTATAINGEISVTWYKEGGSLLAEKKGYHNVTAILSVYSVGEDDLTSYRCEAVVNMVNNGVVEKLKSERFIRLERDFLPTIKVRDDYIYTDYGISEKIFVEVGGKPTPDVHCVFNNGSDNLIRGETYSKEPLTVIRIDVQKYHFGKFQCTAKNIHGSASDSGRLRQGPDVPRILSPNLSNNSDYIDLAFTITSAGLIINSTVNVYRVANSFTCSGKPKAVDILISKSSSKRYRSLGTVRLRTFETYIKDLKEDTTYGLMARVCTKQRCSDFSSCKFIKTSKFNGSNCYSCKAPKAKGVVSPEGSGRRTQLGCTWIMMFLYLGQIFMRRELL